MSGMKAGLVGGTSGDNPAIYAPHRHLPRTARAVLQGDSITSHRLQVHMCAHACGSVCVPVCAHASVCICNVLMCIPMHVCAHVGVFCVCVYMCVPVCAYVGILQACACLCVCVCTCMCVCVPVHVCVLVCAYAVYLCVCNPVCVYVCAHMCVCFCTCVCACMCCADGSGKSWGEESEGRLPPPSLLSSLSLCSGQRRGGGGKGRVEELETHF